MNVVAMPGFFIVLITNIFITILFRIAYITKVKKTCGWMWKTGTVLGVAYVIYIMCAVFRVIDRGGIGGADAQSY